MKPVGIQVRLLMILVLFNVNHVWGQISAPIGNWVEHFPSTWGVISCGYKNRFGHPHKEALQVWKDSEILRTDLQGSIEFRSNGETISVRGFHQDRGWYWIKK